MDKTKHFFVFIGLLISTVVLGILSYCVLSDILVVEGIIANTIVIVFAFIICLTIGFAAFFPKDQTKRLKRKDKRKEKMKISPIEEKTVEEKPVDFEPIDEKETKDEDIPTFKEIKEDPVELKTEVVDSIIDTAIDEIDTDTNIENTVQTSDKPFKILLQDMPHSVEMLRKIGIDVERDEEGKYWIKVEPSVEEGKEEDFLMSVKDHVKELSEEREIKLKSEREIFNKKIDVITAKESNPKEIIVKPEGTPPIINNDVQESLRQRIHKHLETNPDATKEDLAELFNTSKGTAGTYLKKYKKSQEYLGKEEKEPIS